MHSGKGKETGDRSPSRARLLARLARDTAGNTLAIVGAALIPLAAMIGSGVDMSRAYMAKNRLQSACDAASLAGRRVMQNDTLDDNVRAEALRFFNFNFPQGLYETAAFTPTVTRPDQGTIRVDASTTIPTAVMHLFGFQTLPLSVTCDASLDFVNTDVMLVLDTTGSMWRDSNDQSTSDDSQRKITALREAVLALYDELRPIQVQLEANSMRLRYGIVNYSTTVNVGAAIRSIDASYLANSWTYPSRTPIYIQSQSSNTYYNVSRDWCNDQDTLPSTINFPITAKTSSHSGNRWSGTCVVTTATYVRDATSTFGFWYHEPRTFDTSEFKMGDDDVPLPTRTPGTNTTASVWNGCIEERGKVDTIT